MLDTLKGVLLVAFAFVLIVIAVVAFVLAGPQLLGLGEEPAK